MSAFKNVRINKIKIYNFDSDYLNCQIQFHQMFFFYVFKKVEKVLYILFIRKQFATDDLKL